MNERFNDDELRNELLKVWKEQAIARAELSKRIGISNKSLDDFLKNKRNLQVKSRFKILNYVHRDETKALN